MIPPMAPSVALLPTDPPAIIDPAYRVIPPASSTMMDRYPLLETFCFRYSTDMMVPMIGYSSPATAANPGLRKVDAMYVPYTAHAPQSPASMKYLLAAFTSIRVLFHSRNFPRAPFQMNRTSAQAVALIHVKNRQSRRDSKSELMPFADMSGYRKLSNPQIAYPGTYHTPQ